MKCHFRHSLFFPGNRALHSEDLLHSRGIARSGLRPLTKIPYCCLPQESGPCLSPSVADRPLRPAMHHRLGKLLPCQQANAPQIHSSPRLKGLFQKQKMPSVFLWGFRLRFQSVSPGYGQVIYVLLWAGYLRVTHPFATEHRSVPFDLHVLGMPPAFILSQDQTLHLILTQRDCVLFRELIIEVLSVVSRIDVLISNIELSVIRVFKEPSFCERNCLPHKACLSYHRREAKSTPFVKYFRYFTT